MRHILQICTGAWDVPNYTAQDIIARIEAIAAKIDVGGVIIGWNTDASLYREVGAFSTRSLRSMPRRPRGE